MAYTPPSLPQIDVRGAMSGLLQAGEKRGSLPGQLLGQYRDRMLAEEKAIQDQANKDRVYEMQKTVFDNKLLQDQALRDTAKGYRSYAEASTPELDADVMANKGAFIPGNTPMVPSPDGKLMPAVDQDVYNKQAQLQSLYEAQTPTKEEAMTRIINEGISKGADPTQMASLANTLTSGLTSQGDLLKQYQKTADSRNKRNELLYKERSKDNRSSGSTGRGGKSSDPMTVLSKISPSQWIGGDRTDALAMTDVTRTALQGKGWASRDIDKVLSNALQYSSGKTDWTNDDVEFNASMFKDYLSRAEANPKAAVNEYKGYSNNEVPALLTAGDIAQEVLTNKSTRNKQAFDSILGTKPTVQTPNVSTKEVKTETTKPIVTKTKDKILSDDTVDSEDTNMTWDSFSSDKTKPTEIGSMDIGNVTNLIPGGATSGLNFDDANKTKDSQGRTVYQIGDKYFRLPDFEEAKIPTADSIFGMKVSPAKKDMDAEYGRMVNEANARKAEKDSTANNKPKNILEMLGFDVKKRNIPTIKQETGVPTTDAQAMQDMSLMFTPAGRVAGKTIGAGKEVLSKSGRSLMDKLVGKVTTPGGATFKPSKGQLLSNTASEAKAQFMKRAAEEVGAFVSKKHLSQSDISRIREIADKYPSFAKDIKEAFPRIF